MTVPCRLLRASRHQFADAVGGGVGAAFALVARLTAAAGLTTSAPATSIRHQADSLEWHQIGVDGRTVVYGDGGSGPTVLFLHGWALGSRTYKRALRRLVSRGCRVVAPAMPGFGGSEALPRSSMTIDGYADWAKAFLDAVGCDQPVVVIGHSFGGGVGAMLTHRYAESVRYLVLLNAIGGAAWDGRDGRSLSDRPIRDWASAFVDDVALPGGGGLPALRALSEDLVSNLLRNPQVLWRAGRLARTTDLTEELRDLRELNVPVLALTSERDNVIPATAFDALCASLGAEGRTVRGGHSWILADPDHFGEVMHNIVEVEVEAHRAMTGKDAAETLIGLLAETTLPTRLVRRLVGAAPPLWLTSEAPETLAADLSLCHPRLGKGEVRAAATPLEEFAHYRLTVVTRDRPGLLADTCAVLATGGMCVRSATAVTWDGMGIALHSLVIDPGGPLDTERFDGLGERLRRIFDAPPRPDFTPGGAVRVDVSGPLTERATITVTAVDQVGLLWAICRWLADHDVNIEAVHATTNEGVARDTFIVRGDCDPTALADALSNAGVGGHEQSVFAKR